MTTFWSLRERQKNRSIYLAFENSPELLRTGADGTQQEPRQALHRTIPTRHGTRADGAAERNTYTRIHTQNYCARARHPHITVFVPSPQPPVPPRRFRRMQRGVATPQPTSRQPPSPDNLSFSPSRRQPAGGTKRIPEISGSLVTSPPPNRALYASVCGGEGSTLHRSRSLVSSPSANPALYT